MTDKEIKSRLAEARKRKKITQKQMSDALGIGLSTYRDIEKGDTVMLNTNLKKACRFLNVDITDILGIGSDDEHKKTYFQLLRELEDWTPKDVHFTSKEEIEMLDRHFSMDKMKAMDLRNLRDITVCFYHSKIQQGLDQKKSMLAMMSITAVIDYKLSQKGHI